MLNKTLKIAICAIAIGLGSSTCANATDFALLGDTSSISLVEPLSISPSAPLPSSAELDASESADSTPVESVPEPSGIGLLLLAGLGGAIIAVRARLG